MESLIKANKKHQFPASILVVITNNESAPGIKIAKNYYIPVKVIDKKKFNKLQFEINAQKVLSNYKIEMICLAGFMQILSKKFINTWQNKIINIHPSYLPKNKGLNPQKQVLDEKSSYSGCTVHLVSSKVDSGKIILQKKIKVFKKDNEKKLSSKILHLEHKIYPRAIIKLFSNY